MTILPKKEYLCVENAKRMSKEVNWEKELEKLLQKEEELLNGKK